MSFTRQVSRLLDDEHRANLELLGRLEKALARNADAELPALAGPLVRHIEHEVGRHFGFEEESLFPRTSQARHAVTTPGGGMMVPEPQPSEDAMPLPSDLDPEAEFEVARSLARKRLPGLAGLDPQARYRRLAGALARRGFAGPVVHAVLREVLADEVPELETE